MIEGYTNDQVKELIAKEKKRQERQKKQTARNYARQKLMLQKAKAAGITVTEAEIKAELAKK